MRTAAPRGLEPGVGARREDLSAECQARVFGFLSRMANELQIVLDLPRLLEFVMRVLDEEARLDSCVLSLLESERGAPGGDRLVVKAVSGLRKGIRGAVSHPGQGLGWIALDIGQPQVIRDLRREPRWFLKDARSRSAVYVPLIPGAGRRPIGVLSAYQQASAGFSDEDVSFLSAVGAYVARAVEIARVHEELKETASTDPLTGLVNRRVLLQTVGTEIARSRRGGSHCSVVLLDLDRFKNVNDVYGHAIGDLLLVRVAEALRTSVRESDTAARLGGDEFVVLLPDTALVQATELVERLLALAINVPDVAENREAVRFSWGIASWPGDGGTPEELLHVADERLYAMKRVHRTNILTVSGHDGEEVEE